MLSKTETVASENPVPLCSMMERCRSRIYVKDSSYETWD